MIDHDPPQLPHLVQELLSVLVRRRHDELWVDALFGREEGSDLVDAVDVGGEGDVAVLFIGGGDLFGG
jgi:hypothetical protein